MRGSIPPAGAENGSSRTYPCPLCENATGSQDDIYRHLLVSHRKSAITATLLETAEFDGQSPAQRR